MSNGATPETTRLPATTPPVRLRVRLLALAVACAFGGLAVAGWLALRGAGTEQRAIEASALAAARASMRAADREVAAAIARLQALATSPALRTGDLRASYDQLVATPIPDGTWLMLTDNERQLLNTLRPYGFAPLPLITDFGPGSQAAIRRAFATGQIVISPVVWGALAQARVVSVSVPVVTDDRVTHLVENVLSDRHLSLVIEEQRLPPGWRGTLLDRNLATIANAGMVERPTGPGAPESWMARIRGPESEGLFLDHRDGAPVLVAFARSSASDWTALVELLWEEAATPVGHTVRLLAWGGSALGLATILAALGAARSAARPIEALRSSAEEADASRRETEERYRTYWQNTGEALFVLAACDDGRFVFEGLNPAHERLSGLRSAAVAGLEPEECLPANLAATMVERCRSCVASGRSERYEETLDLPTGRRDWESSLVPVCDPASGRVLRLLGSARDVTEKRQHELLLRRMGGRLMTLQDEERRRIARELHDSTAQILLGASFAAARVRAISPDLTEAANDAIEETLSLIEEGQREIRTIAYLLHPPLLDEMGLPAALRWFAKGFSRRSGIEITLDLDPAIAASRLPRDVEGAFFRIVQEALGNAHRHSGCDRVLVSLARVATDASAPGRTVVTLVVRDNGRGFDAAGTELDGGDDVLLGVGLVGMQERMRQIGGQLSVRPAAPRGTIVEAFVAVDLADCHVERRETAQYPAAQAVAWSVIEGQGRA